MGLKEKMQIFSQKVGKASDHKVLELIISYNALSEARYSKRVDRLGICIDEIYKRRENISSEDKKYLLDGLLNNGVRYPTILHFYIYFFLGFNIPRKVNCKRDGHVAPFTFISEMFFEKTRNAIAFANRTGGKTLCMSVLNHLDMAFKKGCEVASAGSTLSQAGKCQMYTKEIHNRGGGFLANELLDSDPTKTKVHYKNGSFGEIITGTEKGFNSPHPNKVRVDEIDLMDRWDIIQQAMSMSLSKGGDVMSQMVFSCITNDTPIDVPRDLSKYPKGIMLKDLKKRFDKGEKLFVFCYDIENNKFTLKPIKNIWKTKRTEVYEITYKWFDGEEFRQDSIKCTEDHLWLLNDGKYKEAKNLKRGDSLKCFDRIVESNIVSVKYFGVKDVYDIEVEDCNNFVANGVVLHNSTRKYSTGVFQRLLDVAADHLAKFPNTGTMPFWKTYKWCIWETVEQCSRKCKKDVKYGDCPAYTKCGGRAKKGAGWYPIDDFITKIVMMDTDTWNTEWLNKKPTGTVFVYGDYWDKDFHIIPRKDLSGEIWYVGGLDFGVSSGHHAVFQGYNVVVNDFKREVEEADPRKEFIKAKLKFFLDYEYRNSGKLTIEALARKIKGWGHWSEGIPIFADPSAAQEKIDLDNLYGVKTKNAVNAVESGISIVRSYLEKVRVGGEDCFEANFYIFDDYLDCSDINIVATTSEFERYRYGRLKDGMPNIKEPVKAYDHGMDVVRYVIQSSVPYFRELFTIMWEDVDSAGGFEFDF